jgi:hypothetical protein
MITEKQGDVFELAPTHYLAHCISRDFALGAGIAVEFDRRYDMRHKLRVYMADIAWLSDREYALPKCIRIDHVFNLITKEKCWQKPTYNSLEQSMRMMGRQIGYLIEQGETVKLVMPRIGCGIDGLTWSKVSVIIDRVLAPLNIEIQVRYL